MNLELPISLGGGRGSEAPESLEKRVSFAKRRLPRLGERFTKVLTVLGIRFGPWSDRKVKAQLELCHQERYG